jgi:predicted porin
MIAKKNLVAAAALMAVATVAQAQSQVKLYGTLDYSVGSFETAHTKGTSVRKTAVESGTMMTSFFGIAGSEDLGGGLKAEFTLESFLAGDTGEAAGYFSANKYGGFWSRGSNIALSGGFGKVAIGQYDNPLFTSGYTYNPFGSSMTFSPTMRHLSYVGQTPALGGVSFDTGWINSLTYETPVFSGLQGFVQFAPKESTATGTSNSYTAAAKYDAGPLSVMATYVKAGRVGALSVVSSLAADGVGPYMSNQKVFDLGASYDFGVAKGFLQYTSLKDSTNEYKNTNYQLGVSAPLSDKATVMASFGSMKATDTSATPGDSATDKVLSIGYDYLLSKRTDVYGVFMQNSQTDKDSGMTLAVGVKHNF